MYIFLPHDAMQLGICNGPVSICLLICSSVTGLLIWLGSRKQRKNSPKDYTPRLDKKGATVLLHVTLPNINRF